MAGGPGSGKTLLARALPGILPQMSIDESLDVTRIYSVADQLPAGTPLIKHRPFRPSPDDFPRGVGRWREHSEARRNFVGAHGYSVLGRVP